jgi:hypothetical protein
MRRLRHAVGHGRRERHVVGVRVDELCEQSSYGLARREEIGRRDGPRAALAPQTLLAGHCRNFGQRRYVGAVQERDVIRDVEQMALIWQRLGRI